jgi:hypothetical protein
MLYKNDWEKAKERFNAWWKNDIIDRAIIQVTAPIDPGQTEIIFTEWDLVHNLDNPDKVIDSFEKYCQNVYFGGESMPNLWLNYGPGIVSGYIGAVPKVREDTVWFETPKDWDTIFKEVEFDAENEWWKTTKFHASRIFERSKNKYFAGNSDLGGNLDILASLRGTEELLIDLFDCPENVKKILKKINQLWLRYFNELNDLLSAKTEGTSNWMSLWCEKVWYPLQCDFSAMISPKLFEEFVAPYLAEQCQWLDNSIYHWDGPGEIPHLDILLDIPDLHGIQWTSGAGNPGVGSEKWFPLYKRIQAKNKLLVLHDMDLNDIENVYKNLSPKGLLISARCKSKEEADELLKKVEKWTLYNS